jgi:hypothetical protein
MDKSKDSQTLEEDSGQTLTPSYLDEGGKVFTFTEVGSEKDLGSFLKNQVGLTTSKKEIAQTQIDAIIPEEKDQNSSIMKKGLIIETDDKPINSEEKVTEMIESNKIVLERGDVFEKLIFVKARIVKKELTVPKPKIVSSIKKSFWIYPITNKDFTQDEKEEADLLTTFGLSPAAPKLTQRSIDDPLDFISEYFANYNVSSASFFSFVLNRNEREAGCSNAYNPGGLRYFFGCLVSDFDQVKFVDKNQRAGHRLEPSQCLLLLESKYPFTAFFNAVLGHLFNVVKVKRLELFSKSYNGNERDASNLEAIRNYDSGSVLAVGQLYPDTQL